MNPYLTHLITFLSGLLTGVLGAFIANRLSERAKSKDLVNYRLGEIKSIIEKMPDLVSEIKADLRKPDFQSNREFYILSSKGVRLNVSGLHLAYYESEHPNLMSKIRILENAGLVFDITEKRTPKYQLTEEFVSFMFDSK